MTLKTKAKFTFHCDECQQKWFAYMLKDEVWLDVYNDFYSGDCCLPCFEDQLGRDLTYDDFMDNIPLNDRLHNELIEDYVCN